MREYVLLSSVIHEHWFSDSVDNSYVVWRYLAFANGVIRVAPATGLQKPYNPITRDW